MSIRHGIVVEIVTVWAAVALVGGDSAARAQTFRVVPLVSGSSIARDINENGDVCGEKPGASPGFVSVYRNSDDVRLLRETAKIPVAFSPNGYFLATNQGALILIAQTIVDGSIAGMATNLPSNFVVRSINDSGIIVGNVAQIGYYRDLFKQPSALQGAGYFGRLVAYGSPGPTQSVSDATGINNSGLVGGWASLIPISSGGPEYPFVDQYYNGTSTAYPGGAMRQISLEKGAIFDLNENGASAGYQRAASDSTCIFPAIIPLPSPGFNGGSGERLFLGMTASSVIPNMEGRVVGLNDSSEGVGWSQKVGDSTKTKYPCLFDAGGTKALNGLLERRAVSVFLPGGRKTYVHFPSLWKIRADLPMDINNSGDIAATATYDTDSTPRAVLLKRL